MGFFCCWTLLTCIWSVTDRQVFLVSRFGHLRHWLIQTAVVGMLGLMSAYPQLMVAVGFVGAATIAPIGLFTEIFSDDYYELPLILICWGLILTGVGAYRLGGQLW